MIDIEITVEPMGSYMRLNKVLLVQVPQLIDALAAHTVGAFKVMY